MNTGSRLNVMLTRPSQQSLEWSAVLAEMGINSVSLSMLAIQPLRTVSEKQAVVAALRNSASWDVVIFVSSNAVNYLAEIIASQSLDWPADTLCLAIGPSTHRAIVERGWQVDGLEHNCEIKDSESLLRLPLLSDMKGKNVAIVRGQGGRELIKQVLTERGALVTTVEVYHRGLPQYPLGELKQCLFECSDEGESAVSQVDAILFASGDTVRNFCRLAKQDIVLDLVLDVPVVVPSNRVAAIATQCGFKTVYVADGASAVEYGRLLVDNIDVLNSGKFSSGQS